mgnify:FL=1
MADDKDKAVSDLHIFAVQVVLCAVFGLAGTALTDLSGLGRVVFILAMFQTGAGFGALAAAIHRKVGLACIPALGSALTGALLGAITAATL